MCELLLLLFLTLFLELKRKNELIQKAKVKSQYYKQLNQDPDDDTPDYVKDVNNKKESLLIP